MWRLLIYCDEGLIEIIISNVCNKSMEIKYSVKMKNTKTKLGIKI